MKARVTQKFVVVGTRRHNRLTTDAPIRVRRSQGPEEYEGTTTDVSLGGIGAKISADFKVGEVVVLTFLSCDSATYRARIVYRRGHHYGLSLLRCE